MLSMVEEAMFRFNADKTMQALAWLLKQPGKDHNAYLKLIKLLYVAEREALIEWGWPITGDKPTAMEHGPALSRTYDAIKAEVLPPGWPEYFETRQRQLYSKRDPGDGHLSAREKEKLKEIAARYRDMDRWQVRDETHDLPEWVRNAPGRSSKTILIKHILEAGGCPEKLRMVMRRAEQDRALSEALGIE